MYCNDMICNALTCIVMKEINNKERRQLRWLELIGLIGFRSCSTQKVLDNCRKLLVLYLLIKCFKKVLTRVLLYI